MRAKVSWTKEQLIIALNLYWKIPYSKISGSSNALIKEIAPVIGRTPAALAYKLMNFTSLDPERQVLGNKGKSAASMSDKAVWDEYFGNWESLAMDSASMFASMKKIYIGNLVDLENEGSFGEGKEKDQMVKTRVNQSDFRQRVLASYNNRCCITGIAIPSLLVASHIVPWAKCEKERLNPKNGLCLNNIHDKAFDQGLITITNDFKVKLSNTLLKIKKDKAVQKYFLDYDNQFIMLPDRFSPSIEFLEYHNQTIFIK